jgi:hypothetical protein
MPKTYRERSSDTILAKEGDPDYQKLMSTRPGFFKDEKHSQESIMRGLEEADDAEKNFLNRGVSKVKKAILGSDVDNELALEQMRNMDAKSPDTAQAKVNRLLGRKKGGTVSSYKSGGKVSSASKRADGCAVKGKTKGRFI